MTEIIDKVKAADTGSVLVLQGGVTSKQSLEEFNSKVGVAPCQLLGRGDGDGEGKWGGSGRDKLTMCSLPCVGS